MLDESLRIVDDSNQVRRINLKDVDKKIERNRGAIARDEAGNVLQVEDVVRCSAAGGTQQGKKGIIVNICRSCLFLWDPKDFENSNGVFAERAMHVMILGNEFLEGVATDSGVMTQNRIMRDKLLHRRVQIVKGAFKGYRGIVSGVHGDEAIVELASKAKKVSVPKSIVEEIEADGSTTYDLQMSDNTRPQNTAGQSQYGPIGGRSVYGGASQHGGLYDGGKTPAMFTGYGGQTPAAETANWGGGSAYGGNKATTQGISQATAGEWGRNSSVKSDTQAAAVKGWGTDDGNQPKEEETAW